MTLFQGHEGMLDADLQFITSFSLMKLNLVWLFDTLTKSCTDFFSRVWGIIRIYVLSGYISSFLKMFTETLLTWCGGNS